jgi:hypothetical protein
MHPNSMGEMMAAQKAGAMIVRRAEIIQDRSETCHSGT